MDLPDWRVAVVVCRIWQALADVVEKMPKIKSERAWLIKVAEIVRGTMLSEQQPDRAAG